MALKNPKVWYRRAAIVALVVVLAGAGLFKLRSVADGWRNAFSLSYWMDRRSGRDLYNSGELYLKRGSRGEHSVLLTFDDGPFPGSGATILDLLKKEQIHATFFVVGKRVKVHPELVRRMIEEGHEVGNHTQDHFRLDTLTPRQILNEMRDCEINVERATGRRMNLFRPPGMRFNADVLRETRALGYTMIGYNVGAKDFTPDRKLTDMTMEETKNMKSTPQLVAKRVLDQVKDGVIILLHDNPSTAAALPTIIRGLKEQGYRFDSAEQFLAELPKPIRVVSNPVCPPPLAAIRLPSTIR